MFSRNQVFCLKNWKLWRPPTTIELNISCWNFGHVSYLPMSTKVCSELFLFCLNLELFAKIKKDLVSTHSFFTFFNNSRSKQNKKIPNTLLQTLLSRKRVQISAKKILKFAAVGARQSFQFFRQIAWFLGNNKALSKFRYRKLCNLISITKL